MSNVSEIELLLDSAYAVCGICVTVDTDRTHESGYQRTDYYSVVHCNATFAGCLLYNKDMSCCTCIA